MMTTATPLSPPRMRRGGGRRPPGWSRRHCVPLLDREWEDDCGDIAFPSSIENGKMIAVTLRSTPRMRRGGGRRPPGWSGNHELPRNDCQHSFETLDDFTILE